MADREPWATLSVCFRGTGTEVAEHLMTLVFSGPDTTSGGTKVAMVQDALIVNLARQTGMATIGGGWSLPCVLIEIRFHQCPRTRNTYISPTGRTPSCRHHGCAETYSRFSVGGQS